MDKIKQEQFIFVLGGFYIISVGNDIKFDNRVTILDSYLKSPQNYILKSIQKVHASTKINRWIKLPFTNIWKCSLQSISWKKDVKYYVFFVGSLLKMVDLEYLKTLREKYNIRYILILVDSWNNDKYSFVAKYFAKHLKFDYIFSFDPEDAKKYGFIYTNTPYSIISPGKSNNIEYDLYLAANVTTKGGPENFHSIYKYMQDKGVSSHYRLVGVSPKKQVFKNEIIYNIPINYMEVIRGVKKSNCILEVLPLWQSGATLRYYEAVCYNKKLLTTNKNVINLPFYNPEYIHVFENPEDIDCEWVKERIPINYGYDGRFSPTHLIDRIVELEDQKEG